MPSCDFVSFVVDEPRVLPEAFAPYQALDRIRQLSLPTPVPTWLESLLFPFIPDTQMRVAPPSPPRECPHFLRSLQRVGDEPTPNREKE